MVEKEVETKDSQEALALVPQPEIVKAIAASLKEGARMIVSFKTPNDFIYTRPGRGGPEFKYVDIGFMELCLNNMYPGRWSFEVIKDQILVNKHIAVLGKLTITHQDGHETKTMQYGSAEIKYKTKKETDPKDSTRFKIVPTDEPIDVADDLKAAASDALKKCASMIGIAFDIYHPKTKASLEKWIGELPCQK